MAELTLELINFLLSERAKPALDMLFDSDIKDHALLNILSDLRKHFSPIEAAAILDQSRLRQKATEKFPLSRDMLFTDESLQQASSHEIAAYHAEKLAGFQQIADLGSGIGGDATAFARNASSVWAVEKNPVLCRILKHNFYVNGCLDRVNVYCADWTQMDLDSRDAVFIDPSRRKEGKRVFTLSEMEPSITTILNLHRKISNIAVKVAPGISHEDIPIIAETEFVSEKHTLKEALLLFGGLKKGFIRTAMILPGMHKMVHTGMDPIISTSEPLKYLYEPDPAVIRASLVKNLAKDIDAFQLDPNIAYLTSAQFVATPFARAWKILQHGPFNLKILNHWLREVNAGEVIVKKRGSPIDPDAFRKKLKTSNNGQQITVFITRFLDKPWMLTTIQDEAAQVIFEL
jgi:predicted RNA methylase